MHINIFLVDIIKTQFFNICNSYFILGFKTVYKTKKGGLRFADLLDKVSSVDPEMRIRFTAAHPKDFPDEVMM